MLEIILINDFSRVCFHLLFNTYLYDKCIHLDTQSISYMLLVLTVSPVDDRCFLNDMLYRISIVSFVHHVGELLNIQYKHFSFSLLKKHFRTPLLLRCVKFLCQVSSKHLNPFSCDNLKTSPGSPPLPFIVYNVFISINCFHLELNIDLFTKMFL